MLLGLMAGLLAAHFLQASMTGPELVLLISGCLVLFVVAGEFIPNLNETRKIPVPPEDAIDEESAWLISKGTEPKSGFPLKKEIVLVGRSIGSDVFLNDKSISRRHAQVVKNSDGFIIKDLDSRNGTFVNGKRIEEQLIRDGDEVSLGNLSFVFKYPPSMKKVTINARPMGKIKEIEPENDPPVSDTLLKTQSGNE